MEGRVNSHVSDFCNLVIGNSWLQSARNRSETSADTVNFSPAFQHEGSKSEDYVEFPRSPVDIKPGKKVCADPLAATDFGGPSASESDGPDAVMSADFTSSSSYTWESSAYSSKSDPSESKTGGQSLDLNMKPNSSETSASFEHRFMGSKTKVVDSDGDLGAVTKTETDTKPLLMSGALENLPGQGHYWKNSRAFRSEGMAGSLLEGLDLVGMHALSRLFPPCRTRQECDLDDFPSMVEFSQRLAALRPSSSFPATSRLAEELFNRTINDEWLRKYIQSDDFDGTWVAIICGLYQSFYLYDSAIGPPLKTMVLLLRLQHLQNFQHIVIQKLLKHSFNELTPSLYIGLLASEGFLVSTLVDSLQKTRDDLQVWADHISSGALIENNIHYPPKIEFQNFIGTFRKYLAFILPMLFGKLEERLQDEKWLWMHFHNMNESNILGSWSTIIGGLYQELYLYVFEDTYFSKHYDSTLTKGRLTILLFRSEHLKNFQKSLEINLIANMGVRMCELNLMEGLSESLNETINILKRKICLTMSTFHGDLEFGGFEFGKLNMFDGSRHPLGLQVENLIDLKLVHTLGGLICTIDGSPFNKEDSHEHTSWCIIRHDITGLLLCVDLKDDAYKNKHHMYDETMMDNYDGVIEVAIIDGETTIVQSLEHDGSSYFGHFKDFAHVTRRGGIPTSCAEKALHTLPQSGFLKEFNLKCSLFHMLAFAYLAGDKDYLALRWRGDIGHIENVPSQIDNEGLAGRFPDTMNCRLQKCSVMYTREGRLIGNDVTWEGDCVQQNSGPDKKEKITDESGKVAIILNHWNLWDHREFTQDDGIDEEKIGEYLAKTLKEFEGSLVSSDTAAVFAQLKQNTGIGVGAATIKIEGHHEHRSSKANAGIEKFLRGAINVMEYLKTTVVVHPDMYNGSLNSLQADMKNGTIAEHCEEFFVVKIKGSCSMQIFLCNPEDAAQGFIWLTDIIVPCANVADKIFQENLKGKSLSISRSKSEMKISPDIEVGNSLLRSIQKKFLKQQEIGSDETMIHGSTLPNFPRSDDDWKFIVGRRRNYGKRNFFLKATECQTIVCSATHYTTGGALVRTRSRPIPLGAGQPSTSSDPSTSSISGCALEHGSCKRICSSRFYVEEDKLIACGKFSNFKGIGSWTNVYWG